MAKSTQRNSTQRWRCTVLLSEPIDWNRALFMVPASEVNLYIYIYIYIYIYHLWIIKVKLSLADAGNLWFSVHQCIMRRSVAPSQTAANFALLSPMAQLRPSYWWLVRGSYLTCHWDIIFVGFKGKSRNPRTIGGGVLVVMVSCRAFEDTRAGNDKVLNCLYRGHYRGEIKAKELDEALKAHRSFR